MNQNQTLMLCGALFLLYHFFVSTALIFMLTDELYQVYKVEFMTFVVFFLYLIFDKGHYRYSLVSLFAYEGLHQPIIYFSMNLMFQLKEGFLACLPNVFMILLCFLVICVFRSGKHQATVATYVSIVFVIEICNVLISGFQMTGSIISAVIMMQIFILVCKKQK